MGVQHSRIDLDVNKTLDSLPDINGGDINDCTDNKCKFNATSMSGEAGDSYSVWTDGEFSTKSSGLRKIRGFASGAATKSSGNNAATDVDYKDNGFISVMNAYWKKKGLNEFTWGEQIVEAAFEGTVIGDIDFSKVGWDFRRKPSEKVSFILMYFHTSYGKCRTLSTTAKLVSSLQMLTPCTLGMRLLHSIPVLWKGKLRVVMLVLEELDLVSQEAMVQESFSSLLPRKGVRTLARARRAEVQSILDIRK